MQIYKTLIRKNMKLFHTTCRWLLTNLVIVTLFGQFGCKKYLEAKSDKSLVIPTTLQDVQALSDSYGSWNTIRTALGDMSDDNFYWTVESYGTIKGSSASWEQADYHVWEKESNTDDIWADLYGNIYQTNVALQTINNITPDAGNINDWNRLKGTCLFVRAYTYSFIANYYAVPYDKATASQKPGIPLRLDPDPNPVSVRASLEETWQQIAGDLKEACKLLPYVNTPKSRPSRAAAFAALARVYLYMGEYELSKQSADSCLSIYSTLLDYNPPNTQINYSSLNNSFTWANSEVLYTSFYLSVSATSTGNWKADPFLYNSYSVNDWRKTLFYHPSNTTPGAYYFKGDYEGTSTSSSFNGLAVDEVYLTRAECRARLNDKIGAIDDLRTLLRKRWKTSAYSQLDSILNLPVTANDALVLILNERRKELVVRGGLRWFDLRRLNKEPQFAKTLTRTVGQNTYSLPPNDPRYTFYIPQIVIQLTGMEQNVR
jgi:starch-binding outer membrane protein, SusD/RagB family